jgi:hypothetical protein
VNPLAVPVGRRAVLSGLITVCLYVFLINVSWTYPPDPDSAVIMQAAQDMLHGNAGLRGWTIQADPYLSLDFRPFDLPFYVGGVALTGARFSLLHVIPTVLYVLLTLAVVATVFACPVSASPRRRVTVAVVAAVPLALPSHFLGYLGLTGSNHVSTIAGTLAALLALERAPLFPSAGPRTAAMVLLALFLLTVALLGDTMTLAMAIVPLFIVAGAAAIRRDLPAEVRRRSVMAAAVAGAAAAVTPVLRWFAVRYGGVSLAPFAVQTQVLHIAAGLRSTAHALIGLNDGNPSVPFSWTVSWASLADVRIVVFAASASLLGRVALAWFRRRRVDWLSTVLTLGSALQAAGLVLWGSGPVRYLLPVIVFVAVVSARQLLTWPASLPDRRWLVPAVCAVIACYAIAPAARLGSRDAGSPPHAVGTWLQRKGLTEGYGDWLDGPVITAATGGTVTIRPVRTDGTRLVPFLFMGRSDWYSRPARAHFVVFNRFTVDAASWDRNVSRAAAEATFGPADRTAVVGPYLILVWNRGIGF